MLVFGHRDWSRRGEFLSVFFAMISRFAIFQRRRHDGRDSDSSASPARRKARRRQRHCRRAAWLSCCWRCRRCPSTACRDLLLAGAEWRQPAGISRPHRDDRRSTASAWRQHSSRWRSVLLLAVLLGERLARSRRPLAEAAGLLGLVDRADRARLSFLALSDRAAGQRPVCAGRAVRSVRAAAGTCSAPPTCRSAPASSAARTRPGCCGTRRRRRSSPATCWPCWSRICWLAGCIRTAAQAALSQLPLTVLMIAYTVFGLWLLSTPTAG